MLELQAFC